MFIFLLSLVLSVVIFYDSKKRFGKPHFLWTVGGLLFPLLGSIAVGKIVRSIFYGDFATPSLIFIMFFSIVFVALFSFVGFKLYRAFTPTDTPCMPTFGVGISPSPLKPGESTTDASTARSCPSCQETLSATARFCHNCGATVEDPILPSCPQCGEAITLGAQFCSGCGNKIN